MDTLINFNDTEDSQDWPESWQKAVIFFYFLDINLKICRFVQAIIHCLVKLLTVLTVCKNSNKARSYLYLKII